MELKFGFWKGGKDSVSAYCQFFVCADSYISGPFFFAIFDWLFPAFGLALYNLFEFTPLGVCTPHPLWRSGGYNFDG